MTQLKRYEFRMAEGEFDEVFIRNAEVHIERMDTTAFWIGIEAEGFAPLTLNTGVHRGTWFFNLEEDTELGDSGRFLQVQRPRNTPRVPVDARAKQLAEAQAALDAKDVALVNSLALLRKLRIGMVCTCKMLAYVVKKPPCETCQIDAALDAAKGA